MKPVIEIADAVSIKLSLPSMTMMTICGTCRRRAQGSGGRQHRAVYRRGVTSSKKMMQVVQQPLMTLSRGQSSKQQAQQQL